MSFFSAEYIPFWIALIPAAGGMWTVWNSRISKEFDARSQGQAALQTRADQQTTIAIDRLAAEIKRLELRVAKLEEERDEAEDKARLWFTKAHEMRHEAFMLRMALIPPQGGWPALDLPTFAGDH